MSEAVERSFALASGRRLTSLHWPSSLPQPVRVLALHGWLDNAASFQHLAAALPGCEILAVDLAGHGRSDWRGSDASYALVDHLPDLIEVLDLSDWAQAVVLGHSMGGAIASLLAVAATERVRALICLDALGPLSLAEDEAPARLRRALKARSEPTPRRRVFVTIEEAVAHRARLSGLSAEAAVALVERALIAVEGGFSWAADPRLQLPSAAPMSEAQVQSLLKAITQPTLVLAAEVADPRLPRLEVAARLQCVPQAVAKRLPGGHHLHIAEPGRVAAEISEFLTRLERDPQG